MTHIPLTQLAHRAVSRTLRPGDNAVDATVGNGNDTLFLAEAVGGTGRVMGFDIQPNALAATRDRLVEAGLLDRVQLLQASHGEMARRIPDAWRRRLRAVMFNLGYLPGGDKDIVTLPDSTLAALEQSLELLSPGGLLSLMAYRGHPGGMQEYEAVRRHFDRLDTARFSVRVERPSGSKRPGPVLFLVQKASV